jgi:hypothetical protein
MWLPCDDVLLVCWDQSDAGDCLHCLSTKNLHKKLLVPLLRVLVPEVSNPLRQRLQSNRKVEVIMDRLPERKPRSRPNAGVTPLNLDNAVLMKSIFNLEDG